MVRLRVVTPVPLHSSQGCSMIDPRAAAVGAWLGKAEGALVSADYTRAVARRADLGAGARPGATTVAVGARRRTGQPQRHRHTLGGFQEVELGLGFQVVSTTGPAGPGLSPTAEQSAEQVTDVAAAATPGRVEQVVEVELSAVSAEAGGEIATAGHR